MGIDPHQFEAMRERTESAIARGKLKTYVEPDVTKASLVNAMTLVEAVTQERKLHDAIMQYCDSQWPRWKYVHARMDKRSTVAVGSQDFTVFMPCGQTLCVECKRKGAKPTAEQLAWHKEMAMLGHVVHVVYALEEFVEITRQKLPATG